MSSLLHFIFLQVIYLQAFVLVLLMGKLVRKVFFGQLRAAEMEVICLFSTFDLASKALYNLLAFNRTILVRRDRNLFSFHSVPGRFQSQICGPFHSITFPEMFSLVS